MSLVAAIAAAAWLGLLTSISPCPLATNVASVSFLARRLESRRRGVLGVIAYAGGRATAYVVVGAAVVWGLAAAPDTAMFLQRFLEPWIGPFLVLVAAVLLGWIPLRLEFGAATPATAEGLTRRGLPGAFLLGALFALTFCPVSAALFFGSLLPLAMSLPVQLPLFAVYGLATALPVAIVAVLIVLGSGYGAALVGGLQRWQRRVQTATAWVILAVGAYLVASRTFALLG